MFSSPDDMTEAQLEEMRDLMARAGSRAAYLAAKALTSEEYGGNGGEAMITFLAAAILTQRLAPKHAGAPAEKELVAGGAGDGYGNYRPAG